MLCQHVFAAKTMQTTSAKVFLVFIFRFVKHKSVKIFDVHVTWLVFINYKQQIYRVFKFLIWDVNWKSQLVFITTHIIANIVFCLNLGKIFFTNRKLNSIIIKIISKFFVILCNSFWMCFMALICLTWHHQRYFWSLFFMLISPFLVLFNSAGNFM